MSRRTVFEMDGKEVEISKKSKSKNRHTSGSINTTVTDDTGGAGIGSKKSAEIKALDLPVEITPPSVDEYLATVSPKLAEIITSGGVITKDLLENEEFTSILRIGGVRRHDDASEYLFPSVNEALKTHLNMRGLPIKLYVTSTTNEGDSGSDKRVIELFKHQVVAIKHMISKEAAKDTYVSHGMCGSILKLEMGLGKTLLAITGSLISPRPSYPNEKYGKNGYPTLIIASKTVILVWQTDGFAKFFGPSVRVLYYHKSQLPIKTYNSMSRSEIVKYDFVVTSYDAICSAAKDGNDWEAGIEMGDPHTLMAGKIQSVHCRIRDQIDHTVTGHRILFHTPWERVVADESQRFSNPKTFTYKAVMAVYGRHKLCLTGTPIKNNSLELWAQLRWCGYNGTTRAILWKRSGLYLMKDHKLTQYILALDTVDTEIKLPPKLIEDKTSSFEGMEKQAYEFVLKIARNVYDEMMAKMCNFACVLALFTRLRQLCIAPYLITAESKREKMMGREKVLDNKAIDHLRSLTKGPLSTWIHDKTGTAGMKSCKMQMIVDVIKKIPENEKVIIFSTFTSCLDLLSDTLNEYIPEFIFEQMDGDTNDRERAEVLASFRGTDNVRGLLMTYKVGSEGLTLIEANHIICIEPWWTPTVELQTQARAHRPGQTKTVHVHRIYIKNSVEDRILAICKDKMEIAKSFLEGTSHTKPGLDKYTLGQILGL